MRHVQGLRRPRKRLGVAAVELALVLPILLLVLVGIWEGGRMIEAHQIISSGAREGARQASTGLTANAQVEDVVYRYLENAGVPTKNAKVAINVSGDPKRDVGSAEQLEKLSVTVTVPTRDVVWFTLKVFTPMTSNLEYTSVWYAMKNKVYPTPSEPAIDY